MSDNPHDSANYIAVGVVTDNSDPENAGRVKVQYPWLGDDFGSFWARISTPMGGSSRGFMYLPEIGDEVLCAFEHGDIHYPYIIGGLWNGQDQPPEPNSSVVAGGNVQHRIIKTRIGHKVFFDDTNGKGEMTLTTANGHILTLNDRDQNITIKTTQGHTVLLDDQNRKIQIVDMTGNNKMTIDSSQNSIEIDCMGNFTIDATGQVSIQGQQGISLNTPMQVSVEGDAGVSVQTDAQLSMQGLDVSVNGDASVQIQGATVMIN